MIIAMCYLMSLSFNAVGMYVTRAEIMREGNENLLNNLDEGVII